MKSIIEKRIDLLKIQNDRLTSLLKDPQPGLLTWLEFVPKTIQEMQIILDGERDK